MPSLDFAAGILNGYFGSAQKDRERREKLAMDLADFAIRSGRVGSMHDLDPILAPLFESSLFPPLRKGGKGRAGAGGGGGEGLPGPVGGILDAVLHGSPRPGQAAPGAQAPAAPAGPAPPAAPAPQAVAPAQAPAPAGQAPADYLTIRGQQVPMLSTEQVTARDLETRRRQGLVDIETERAKTRALSEEDQRQIAERTQAYKQADPTLSDLDARIMAVEEVTGRRLTPTTGAQGYTPIQRGVAGSTLVPEVKTMMGLPLTDDERKDPATTWDVFQYRVPGRAPELRAMPSKPGRDAPPGEATTLNWAYENKGDPGTKGETARRILAEYGKKQTILDLRGQALKEGLTGEETEALEAAFDETFGTMPDGRVSAYPKPETEHKARKEFDSRSPRAMFEAGLTQWATGQAPGLGFSRKQIVRSGVANIVGRIASVTGISQIEAEASYGATRSALRSFGSRAALVDQASDAFRRNLQLARDASATVTRSDIRPLNKAYLALVLNFTAAPELTRFETYIYTAVREAARVATQQTSGGGLTDWAQRRASELINAMMGGATFEAASQALVNDVASVQASMANQRQILLGQIHGMAPGPGQTPGGPPPGGPGGPPPPPPATPDNPDGLVFPRRRG